MSYQKTRDEFVGVIVEEVSTNNRGAIPQWARRQNGVALARLILRNAATMQRLAVLAYKRELTDGEKREDDRCQLRIEAACKPWGIRLTLSDDPPRGAVVTLRLPSGRSSGCEDGYCVPTR